MARRLFLIALGTAAVLSVALAGGQDTLGRAIAQVSGAVSQADGAALDVTVSVSRPANGSFLAQGEKGTVTVTLKDKSGAALTRDAFSTLALYMYGPQEATKTVTAPMLNASEDRTKTPHHYIDLLNNPSALVSGNTLRYPLLAVGSEEAGTYIATVRAVLKGPESRDTRMFALTEFQVKSATVEKQIVATEKCAACHRGADSGQIYMHHVDPGRSAFGSPEIDSQPPQTCKSCHNNNGYAAYRGDVNDPAVDDPSVRTPDPLVRRAHGVHNGSHLETTFNIDPESGNFADYIHVEFPANVRNCTRCHADDRYKTQPSRLACGACHDATWFGDVATKPADRKLHPGGPQANDASCAVCHPADSGGLAPISVAHKVPAPAFTNVVELVMSSPANGKFFVAGESPQVGVTIKDAATGAVIDPNSITETAFRRANLYVSGPRSNTKPVLTSAVVKTTTYANNDLRVLSDASKADSRLSRSDTKITYQLADVAGLAPGTYTAFVETLPPAPNIGGWALFNFQVGTATIEKKPATSCTDCHGDTTMHTGYFAVRFDTDICKNCHDYERQIAGKSGWTQSNNGFGAAPLARRIHGVHFGRYLDKPEEVHSHDYSHVILPQDVRNCTKCHSETSSWNEKASRVACLACHDTDAAIGHATLQTIDPTPAEPYSGQQTETCVVCHGKNREVSPQNAHNISNPYQPPYPREP